MRVDSRASIAPGKIIVTGEYVGIFGEPVTLAAVNLHTKVNVSERNDKRIILSSEYYLGESIEWEREELMNFWEGAVKKHQEYLSSGDKSELLFYRSEKLYPASLAGARAMSEIDERRGVNVLVNSTLPIGAGLGSSASLSVAIIGGIWSYFRKEFSVEKLNQAAFEVEQILNGKPSGADNSAITYGGWLEFRNNEGGLRVNRVGDRPISENIYLIDGGKPEETTLDMIAKVLEKKNREKKRFETLIERDRRVTELTLAEIRRGRFAHQLLNESQLVLEEMGVIGERGREIIRGIWGEGGYAKVSGAGGIKSGVGTILAYIEKVDALNDLAQKYNFSYQSVTLGGEGWQIK